MRSPRCDPRCIVGSHGTIRSGARRMDPRAGHQTEYVHTFGDRSPMHIRTAQASLDQARAKEAGGGHRAEIRETAPAIKTVQLPRQSGRRLFAKGQSKPELLRPRRCRARPLQPNLAFPAALWMPASASHWNCCMGWKRGRIMSPSERHGLTRDCQSSKSLKISGKRT